MLGPLQGEGSGGFLHVTDLCSDRATGDSGLKVQDLKLIEVSLMLLPPIGCNITISFKSL